MFFKAVEERDRPQFKGTIVHDELTGTDVKQDLFSYRLFVYACTTPILVGTILGMVTIISTVFTTQVGLQYFGGVNAEIM
jgi:hypothetical protein